MDCKTHDKVYSGNVYLTYPTQRSWICRNCLETGVDVGSHFPMTDFNDLMKKKKKEQANE